MFQLLEVTNSICVLLSILTSFPTVTARVIVLNVVSTPTLTGVEVDD